MINQSASRPSDRQKFLPSYNVNRKGAYCIPERVAGYIEHGSILHEGEGSLKSVQSLISCYEREKRDVTISLRTTAQLLSKCNEEDRAENQRMIYLKFKDISSLENNLRIDEQRLMDIRAAKKIDETPCFLSGHGLNRQKKNNFRCQGRIDLCLE